MHFRVFHTPVGPLKDAWMHPVLDFELKYWIVTLFLNSVIPVLKEPGEHGNVQGVVLGLFGFDRGWQLLWITHHHQLVEAQAKGDQALWLNALTSLVHDAHTETPEGGNIAR